MMKSIATRFVYVVALTSIHANMAWTEEITKPLAQRLISGPGGVSIAVRMQGPYDAEVPLQTVCYFKRTANSDSRLFGAPVELDKRLGGLIASLRARHEFSGDEYETLPIDLPQGTIKPKRLLLIGLGEEGSLSLERMERVGRTALREAVEMGATEVAFAPLIKDAGNNKLPAGDVENAVVRGMLLAYDTERRLQKQGFAKEYRLDLWIVEAGPAYFDETVAGVEKAVAQAADSVAQRDPKAYSSKSKQPVP